MRSLRLLMRTRRGSKALGGLSVLLASGLLSASSNAQTLVEQVTHFKAGPLNSGDQFGVSVAIDGDTLVVGRRRGPGVGTAIVFRKGANGWFREGTLSQAFPSTSDFFGHAVAISGDLIAVGALFEDGGSQGINGDQQLQSATGGGSGAVYIFERQGSTWIRQAYIKASNANLGDNFGVAVALEGDTLVVGAGREYTDPNDPTPTLGVPGVLGTLEGAVYVFARSGASWTEDAYIKPSVPSVAFGVRLTIEGDTFVVGAPGEPDPLFPFPLLGECGAAYVFAKNAGSWFQEARLKPSLVAAAGGFGSGVDIDGDRIVVGAIHASGNKGAVTVFKRSGLTWIEEAWIASPVIPFFLTFNDGIAFGVAVALEDDTVVVGAPAENGGTSGFNGDQMGTVSSVDSGAAYRYRLSQGSLQLETYIKASNPEHLGGFGVGIALQDGRLFVGAPNETSGSNHVNGDQTLTGTPTGAVYEFDLDGPDASAIVRNVGNNPASFTSTAPEIGSLWQGSVDLTTTGHPFALMAFFLQATQINLGQPDQWLLVGPQFPSGEIFGLAPAVGPNAQFQLNIPALTTLIGIELHAQAFHFGGAQPIVCSNALDLLIGN